MRSCRSAASLQAVTSGAMRSVLATPITTFLYYLNSFFGKNLMCNKKAFSTI